MKIQQYIPKSSFQWTKDYMIKVVTSGKSPLVSDPLIINAFNRIDRADFVPINLKPLAYADQELEIGYGEKLTRPTIIAEMLSVMKPKVGGKYLDIGTGTGYVAFLLANIAGSSGHVYSIERVQWLWELAREQFKKYRDISNLDLLYRDGLDGLVTKAPYDGIHLAFAVNEVPEILKNQLKVNGGVLVAPTEDMNLRVIERHGLDEYTEEIKPGFIFDKAKLGLA